MNFWCRLGLHRWQLSFQHKQRVYDGVWFDIDRQRCLREGCRYSEWQTNVEVSPHQIPTGDTTHFH